jgi:hypothetical protein
MVWFSVFLWMSLRVNAPSLMDSHAIKSKTNKTKQNKTKQNNSIFTFKRLRHAKKMPYRPVQNWGMHL